MNTHTRPFANSSKFSQLKLQLIQRYSEPTRYYHNLDHINEMLIMIEGFKNCINYDLTYLMIWYHDAIYDPTRTDNEEKSAELAMSELKGIINDSDLHYVCQGIIATKHTYSSVVFNPTFATLIDIDLYNLSHDWKYPAYARAIRKEYAHVSDEDYINGRKIFLNKMLNRPIYSRLTHLTEKARENMMGELISLNKHSLL